MKKIDTNNIKLRSVQVQNIIGKEPPSFVHVGIYVLAIMMAILVAVAFFLPVQICTMCKAVAIDNRCVELTIPYKFAGDISMGLHAEIEFKNDNDTINSDKRCITIIEINKDEVFTDGHSCFSIKANVEPDSSNQNLTRMNEHSTILKYKNNCTINF